jgi:hypothetical protein
VGQVLDLQKKVPWLAFDAAKEKYNATRAEFKKCEKQLKEKEALLFTAKRPLEYVCSLHLSFVVATYCALLWLLQVNRTPPFVWCVGLH